MLNWLKNRLSPAKAKTPRWQDLAGALELFWDELFTKGENGFDANANLRSIYTADEAGKRRKLAEYGERYEKNLELANLEIALALRKTEILEKDTSFPSEMLIVRSLGSRATNPITPLYALPDENYGSRFYTLEQLAKNGVTLDYASEVIVPRLDGSFSIADPSEMLLGSSLPFLTSRVAFVIELTDLAKAFDNSVYQQIKADFKYIKPLHIVFQYFIFKINLLIQIYTSHFYSLFMEKSLTMYSNPDAVRCDGWVMGTDAVYLTPKVDSGWRVGDGTQLAPYLIAPQVSYQTLTEHRIKVDSLFVKRLATNDSGFSILQLGESLLRLDGGWDVGGNSPVALSGSSMLKPLTMNAKPEASYVYVWTSELPYPVAPAKIGSVITIDGMRSISGGWKLDDICQPCKKVTPVASWKVLHSGIIASSDRGYTATSQLPVHPYFIDTGITLNGLHKLNGIWPLGGGVDGIKLAGTWQLGSGGAPRIVSDKTISKATELSGRGSASVSSAWDKSSEMQYPRDNNTLGMLISLDGLRTLDSSWKLSGTRFPSKKISTSANWKILNNKGVDTATSVCGVIHGQLLVHPLCIDSLFMLDGTRRLDGSWWVGGVHGIKLDGDWHLGDGGAPKIVSGKTIGKLTTLSENLSASVSSAWDKSSEMQYPRNSTRLSKAIPLDGLKRLDSAWKLSGVLGGTRLDGSWDVFSADGIECSQDAYYLIGGHALPISVNRLSQGAAKITSTPRKTDGSWRVSADNKLNGKWGVGESGVWLSAPNLDGIAAYRLDGEWNLESEAYNQLDGGWKVGESTGVTAESWINIRRMHH